jgi:hypothetical protein
MDKPPTLSSNNSFPKQAATFSVYAPFLSFAIGIFLQPLVHGERAAMIILGLLSTLLILVGLILGIVALAATRRHGRTGIFGKAIAGTIINGLLVLLILASIPGMMKAMERAKAMQEQQTEQNQR